MSACPIGDSYEQVVYPITPSSLSVSNPDPSDESCNVSNQHQTTNPSSGTETTIEQTVFCSGPPGPQGDPGSNGADGSCGLGFEDRQEWSSGEEYYNQEENAQFGDDYHCNASVVTNSGSTYRCVYGHTAGSDPDGDEPGVGLNWEFYWLPMSLQGEEGISEQKKGLMETLWDHITNIPNWTLGDWLLGIGAVAAMGWAYNEIEDMMSFDGFGDEQAGSQFNGTPSYSGGAVNGTLPTILEHLCADFTFATDTSLLSDHEVSFRITPPIVTKNIISLLALVYGFSITQSGNTIRFIPFDELPVKTITFDDMGFGYTSNNSSKYKIERVQGIDLPRKCKVVFVDRDLNYFENTASYEIEGFDQGQEITINLPFVMTIDEAQAIAERLVLLAHIEATEYEYTLSFNDHMELEPGDNITTPLGIHRIKSIRVTNENTMVVTAVDNSFSENLIVPSGSGVGTSPEVVTTVIPVGYSNAVILDLPPLDSNDKEGRVYAAVFGYGAEGWRGAGVYESFDGGGSYQLQATSGQEATVGRVATATAEPTDYHVWDDDTVIEVELKTGQLTSATDDTLLDGTVNTFMLGNEMIAFGQATLTGVSGNGNDVYQLTHLLRGLQGTEWAVGSHQDGEMFVLIDDSLIELPYPIGERGKERKYKIVSIGSDTSKGIEHNVTPYGLNLIPWAPSHGDAETLGDTDDWLITWEMRSRFLHDQVPNLAESPPDFDFAGWTMQILDGGGTAVRTEQGLTKPQFTYTEAMQITDFGSVQGCITVRVFMMSSVVGGGYGSTFSCT